MIAIIGMLEIEIDKMKSIMDDIHTVHHLNRDFYRGTIHEKPVVVVNAGIGKVNAATTLAMLFETFEIEYVVNIGVAGGINLPAGTLVVADRMVYHDVDATNFGYLYGQVPGEQREYHVAAYLKDDMRLAANKLGLEFKLGAIATGDQFIQSVDQIKPILDDIDCLCVDMEGAAIAQVCEQYHKPFIAIRTVTDEVGEQNQTTEYREFSETAANVARDLVETFLKS